MGLLSDPSREYPEIMRCITSPTSSRRARKRYFPGAALTALGGVLALGLSGCATEDEQSDRSADPVTNETTVVTQPENSPSPDEADQSTLDVSSPTAVPPVSETDIFAGPIGNPGLGDQWVQPAGSNLMVTDVRIASHEGFDRVVFDMEGEGTPGWMTMYTRNPTQQGSGNPLDYTGDIALQVGVDGTNYPNELGVEPPILGTFPGSGSVNEVSYSSLFEGRTEFVIGLQDQLPYAVGALENPTRLVIDFVHG